MQTSIFLARLIGPVFAAVGVGLLINFSVFQAITAEFLRSYALIYISGVLVLLAGLSIANLHNVWTRDWRVILTVLGWLMVIGGIMRIVFPQVVISVGATVFSHTFAVLGGICLVLLGGYLSYNGYANSVAQSGAMK